MKPRVEVPSGAGRTRVMGTILAAGLVLSACAGQPTVSCTIVFNPNTSTGRGQTKAANLATADVATIDTSTMSATITGTDSIVSGPGVYTVNLMRAGVVVASTQAAYARAGNTFTAANPAALNAWIRGYAGIIDEVDLTLNNLVVSQIEGTNSMTLSVKYNGGSYASATTTWQGLNYQHY